MSMFKKALVAFTAVAASFALASPTLAANPPIEAPPTDVQLTISFDNARLIGGHTVIITVRARSGGKGVAGTMTVTANDGAQATPTPAGFDRLPFTRHTNAAGNVVIRLKTHVVASIMSFPVTARFVPDNVAVSTVGARAGATVPAFYSIQKSAVVSAAFRRATTVRTLTLLPLGSGGTSSGLLPNTGGTQAWYLIVGGLLFVGGASVLTVTRRRSKNIF